MDDLTAIEIALILEALEGQAESHRETIRHESAGEEFVEGLEKELTEIDALITKLQPFAFTPQPD